MCRPTAGCWHSMARRAKGGSTTVSSQRWRALASAEALPFCPPSAAKTSPCRNKSRHGRAQVILVSNHGNPWTAPRGDRPHDLGRGGAARPCLGRTPLADRPGRPRTSSTAPRPRSTTSSWQGSSPSSAVASKELNRRWSCHAYIARVQWRVIDERASNATCLRHSLRAYRFWSPRSP